MVARHGILLAVENHKDWRADELLAILKRVGNDHVGVCLDTGNSVALLEDPMDVIEALAPGPFTTHFKDMGLDEYRDGFLLAEVPLGSGVLDLPRAVRILRAARPEIRFNIEMITRDPLRVPCLAEKYWATFPDLPGRHLARTLSLVRDHPPSRPLPRISQLPRDEQLRAEDRQRPRVAWPSHGSGSACRMRTGPRGSSRRGSRPLNRFMPGGDHERSRLGRRGRGDGRNTSPKTCPAGPEAPSRGVKPGCRSSSATSPAGTPQRSEDEVARIRESLDEEGIRVLGFAAAPGDGETWAMIVESEDLALLEDLVNGLAD